MVGWILVDQRNVRDGLLRRKSLVTSGTVYVSVRERLRKPCMFCNCKTSFSRDLEKVRSHHRQGNLIEVEGYLQTDKEIKNY